MVLFRWCVHRNINTKLKKLYKKKRQEKYLNFVAFKLFLLASNSRSKRCVKRSVFLESSTSLCASFCLCCRDSLVIWSRSCVTRNKMNLNICVSGNNIIQMSDMKVQISVFIGQMNVCNRNWWGNFNKAANRTTRPSFITAQLFVEQNTGACSWKHFVSS